ncbi:unnamed protein product [Calypogeia fissa]
MAEKSDSGANHYSIGTELGLWWSEAGNPRISRRPVESLSSIFIIINGLGSGIPSALVNSVLTELWRGSFENFSAGYAALIHEGELAMLGRRVAQRL